MKNAPFHISDVYFSTQSVVVLALALVIAFVLLLNVRREVATFAIVAFVVGAILVQ